MRRRQERHTQTGRGAFYCALSLIFFVLVLWLLFAPEGGYMHYRKVHRQLQVLEQETIQLQAKNKELKQEIIQLKTDEANLEKVAREKYGLLREDERLYEVGHPDEKH